MRAFKQILVVLGVAALIVIPVALAVLFFTGYFDGGTADSTTASSVKSSTSQPANSSQKDSETATSASETKETTATSEAENDPVTALLDQMSLSEKVGQLFLARVPETGQIESLQTYDLGGYLLFGRDVEGVTASELKDKIASFREASKYPLLIGADEEGGTVSRLSRNSLLVDPPFQSPQSLYQAGGWQAITDDTVSKAQQLKDFGIDTGLFPIADVATDPNAFIYDRTIGMDAAGTEKYVTTVVEALAGTGSGSTLKHFPGYGNNADSHTSIVTDSRPLSELESNDFKPFIAGIKAGVDSILVSHNIVTAIDDQRPASISPAIHEVLRKDLGFKGVIMTDDMDMAGLANFITQEEAGLAALQAGNDLILSSTYAVQIPRIIEAVENGEYSQEDLDASVRRVLTWKAELGLLATE